MSRPHIKLKVSAPPKTPKLVFKTSESSNSIDAGTGGSLKRKKPAEHSDDEEDPIADEPRPTRPKSKRAKIAEIIDDFEIPTDQMKDRLLRITAAIRDHKDRKGRQLSTLFHALPSRVSYPDYYTVIKNPICLNQIQTRVNTSKYQSVKAFRNDFKTLFDNAKEYNVAGSQIYSDAETLWALFEASFSKLSKEFATVSERYPEQQKEKKKTIKVTIKPLAPPPPPPETTKDDENDTASLPNIDSPLDSSAVETPAKAPTPQKSAKVKSTQKPADAETLFKAILDNNTKEVERCLKKVDSNIMVEASLDGVTPYEVDGKTFQWAPLHLAAYLGRSRICDTLKDHGARIDLEDTLYKTQPVGWGAKGDRVGVIKRLIKMKGYQKDYKNTLGQTAYDMVPDKKSPHWAGVFYPEPKIETGGQSILNKVEASMSKESRNVTRKDKNLEINMRDGKEKKKEPSELREPFVVQPPAPKAQQPRPQPVQHQYNATSLGKQYSIPQNPRPYAIKAPSALSQLQLARPDATGIPYSLIVAEVGQPPLSPPPDLSTAHRQTLVSIAHKGIRNHELPERYLQGVSISSISGNFSLSLSTKDVMNHSISVPRQIYPSRQFKISLSLAPGGPGSHLAVRTTVNRVQVMTGLSTQSERRIEGAFEVADGLNALEISVVAFIGDGDVNSLALVNEGVQRYLVFLQW